MSRNSASLIANNIIAILSFVVYATAVLMLHQDQSVRFEIEENGPLPAAMSHRLYGAPLGLIDSGFIQYFTKDAAKLSAGRAVEQAAHGAASQTHVLSISMDGVGVGGIVMAELGFVLFGSHADALPLLFVLLIGISAACFLGRYRDERMSAVTILLLALTLLLVTPISEPTTAAQAPVGGIRYYSVIGILPALHWCFEFADSRRPSQAGENIRWVLLSVQVAILGMSILVRGSPIYLLVPVVASAVFALRRQNDKPKRLLILIRLLIPAVALVIGLGGLTRLTFPEYAKAGRLFQPVWHRVFISLGAHPAWPFPGVREKYNCPEISEGIVSSIVDRNGHCVWLDYAHRRGMSDATIISKVYDADYMAAMRAAFFDIVRAYPREVFQTFFYYKPKRIVNHVVAELRPEWSDATRSIAPLAALQILLVIAFIGTRLPSALLRDVVGMVSVLCLFLLPALIPQLIAWTNPATAIDLFVFVLCGCTIGVWLVISFGFRLVAAGIAFLLRRGGFVRNSNSG